MRLIILFLLLLVSFCKTNGQASISHGKLISDDYHNRLHQLTDSILIDARTVVPIESSRIEIFNQSFEATCYKINTDQMYQAVCNYGNPNDNVYAYQNLNYKVTLIKDTAKRIFFKLLDSIQNTFTDSTRQYYTKPILGISSSPRDVSLLFRKEIKGSHGLVIMPSTVPGDQTLIAYIYFSGCLLIVRPEGNDRTIRIGELDSFTDNLRLILDNVKYTIADFRKAPITNHSIGFYKNKWILSQ